MKVRPPHDQSKAREKVIIFTRYPQPGETKTRLIPFLGPEGAADLHRHLAEQTFDQARLLAKHRDVSLEVRFQGGGLSAMKQWFEKDCVLRDQPDGDLGYRMAQAFQEAFDAGYGRVVLVGTDIPGLSGTILENVLDRLHSSDLVLGPSRDGGYYLVGLSKPCAELFEGIPWSTAEVLEATLRTAQRLGLSVQLVQPLQDIDRPEDLRHFSEDPTISEYFSGVCLLSDSIETPNSSFTVSIIIPTLNEASCLSAALASVQGIPDVEVVVVDGGSNDGTLDIAASHGVRLLRGPRGKAAQMNLGAALARGNILLFLHADTQLPENWKELVQKELDEPDVVAGAFRLRIQGPRQAFRIIERLANFRSTRFQMPYGDQALFLKADLFHKLGGFPNFVIMEDFEIIRVLKRFGRVSTLEAPAVTSARRWLERGLLRTTLINQTIILFYFLGVSPGRLERLYGRGMGNPKRAHTDSLSKK